MVKTGTSATHPVAFLDQPFAAPHQSAGSEVPSDSFPPGEAERRTAVGCLQIVGKDGLLVPFEGNIRLVGIQ